MNGPFTNRNPSPSHPAVVTLVAALLVAQTGLAALGTAAEPVRVTVSILPQEWFVKQIGGDLVEVEVLVGPGHSPATYEPTPRQMAVLGQADLFLAAGVPFEQGLVPRVRALPDAPAVAGPESASHDHHHEIDPHTWLDPHQAMALADTVESRLRALAPASAPVISQRGHELKNDLLALDERVRTLLAPFRGRSFIVFHPAFGHFAAAYGLVQVSIQEGGHEPGPRHLAEVIEAARASGAQTVVVQPQFSRRSAETVAEAIGGEVVVLDPLGADYPANLLHLARTLADLFADSVPPSQEDRP